MQRRIGQDRCDAERRDGGSRACTFGGSAGRSIEAGAGRYLELGRHWTAEGYAGIGRGEVSYSGERTALWRLFAQPSIGYASRNFDFAITTRLCYVDHDKTQITVGHPNLSDEAYSALQNEIAHARMLKIWNPGIRAAHCDPGRSNCSSSMRTVRTSAGGSQC